MNLNNKASLQQDTCACPLCGLVHPDFYCEDKRRHYFQCSRCQLVFAPNRFHLTQSDEKAEYDKHENTKLDEGYRRFLNRTLSPLLDKIDQSKLSQVEGLDFGCGQGAALSQMAAEQGVTVHNYDLYYRNDPTAFDRRYDFITMTEVLEHIARPMRLFDTLDSLLKPKALLAVMTKRVRGKAEFKSWHYKNDPTHICFYSEDTFHWLATRLNYSLEVVSDDVVFFRK